MIELNWIEVIGYVASAIIAVSLTMSSIVKLRVLNLLGAFLFGTYGVFISSIPVALVNYFIATVNIFYLWKYWRIKQMKENSIDKTTSK